MQARGPIIALVIVDSVQQQQQQQCELTEIESEKDSLVVYRGPPRCTALESRTRSPGRELASGGHGGIKYTYIEAHCTQSAN